MRKVFLIIAALTTMAAIARGQEVKKFLAGIGDTVAPVVLDKGNISDAPAGQIIYDIAGKGFFGLSASGGWVALSNLNYGTALFDGVITGDGSNYWYWASNSYAGV